MPKTKTFMKAKVKIKPNEISPQVDQAMQVLGKIEGLEKLISNFEVMQGAIAETAKLKNMFDKMNGLPSHLNEFADHFKQKKNSKIKDLVDKIQTVNGSISKVQKQL